jgi:hypothetical protein
MNAGGAGQPESLTNRRESCDEVQERRSRSREDDELLAALAAALNGHAAPTNPQAVAPTADLAERWRPTGGALTGPSTHIDAANASPGVDSAGPGTESRLVARIETPEMGTICVVVDRSESGMKVVLAIDHVGAARYAEAESPALVRALESVGLAVASVSVTPLTGSGITFAQVRDAIEVPDSAASADGETSEGKPQGRSRRRLNLVG